MFVTKEENLYQNFILLDIRIRQSALNHPYDFYEHIFMEYMLSTKIREYIEKVPNFEF